MIANFALASSAGGGQVILYAYQAEYAVWQLSMAGESAAAEGALHGVEPAIAHLKQEKAGNLLPMTESLYRSSAAAISLMHDQWPQARDAAIQAVAELQSLKPTPGFEDVQRWVCLFIAADIAGRAEYLLGDFAGTERSERLAVEARQKFLSDAVSDRRDLMLKTTWLTMAIARQGRIAEAAQLIAPAVSFHRQLAQRNRGDRWVPLELAMELYAQALSDPAHRESLLRESAGLFDAAPASIRALHDIQLWRQRVESALHGKT
jgi:hypothetical protein